MRNVAVFAVIAIGAYFFLKPEGRETHQYEISDEMAAQIKEDVFSSIQAFDQEAARKIDEDLGTVNGQDPSEIEIEWIYEDK